MPRRDLRAYLHDVVECCDAIATYAQNRTFEQYRDERGFRAQVEREFITIGEALHQAEKIDPALAGRIHSLRAVVGFRNRLVHGYETLDHAVVWAIVTKDVPVLRRQAQAELDAG